MALRIPEGHHIELTRQVVKEGVVELYPFKFAAAKRAAELNRDRTFPSYRWEYERVNKLARKLWHPLARWAVVPYQNIIVPD